MGGGVTRKERTELIAIGVGVLLLAIFLLTNLMKVKKRTAAGKTLPVQLVTVSRSEIPQEPSQVPTALLGPLDSGRRERQLEILKSPWGREPFYHKKGAIPVIRSELVLKGIVARSDGKTAALINDAIVEEGGEVEGRRVKKIEPTHVILDQNGREFILELPEEGEPAP